jgi:hypothetical protein
MTDCKSCHNLGHCLCVNSDISDTAGVELYTINEKDSNFDYFAAFIMKRGAIG